MDQELDEFELLWPEYYADHEAPAPAPVASKESSLMTGPTQRCSPRSRPVDVPRAALILRRSKDDGEEDQEVDGGGGNKEINIVVPPHLLLSVLRRPDGETAASSWSTATARSGRPRKRARDLRHLRNSVLRMTGFIEG